MKQEKYEKAMGMHTDKLHEYAMRLHDFVDEMNNDSVSYNDIIGMLEVEKMFRFNKAVEYARNSSLADMLGDLAELLGEEEE